MTLIRAWLSAKIIYFGLWLLGYNYREIAGLECVLGHVKAYREKLEEEERRG